MTVKVGGESIPLDRQAKRLLAALVARRGRPASPDELAGELDTSEAAVRNGLSRLRKKVGDDVLPSGRGGYRLGVDRRQVDAWWLLETLDRSLDDLTDEGLLAVLDHGESYPGVHETDTIDGSRLEIRNAQKQLAVRVIEAGRRSVMVRIVGLIDARLHEDPYDEELIGAAARLHAELFGRRTGLGLLRAATTELVEVGLAPSTGLTDLELELLGDEPPNEVPHVGSGRSAPRRSVGPRGFPASFSGFDRPAYVPPDGADFGSLADRSDPDRPHWIAVRGPAGVGKTRFCVELAAAMFDGGAEVIHIEPARAGAGPWFQLFAEAFPEVGELIEELMDARADVADFRHSVAQTLRACLGELTGNGPAVVVITRADRFDTESVEALWYLLRSPMPGRLTVVLAGDTHHDRTGPRVVSPQWPTSVAWESFVRDLADGDLATVVDIEPLDDVKMEQLVRGLHPTLGRVQAAQFARRVRRASGGLPGMAIPLIEALDSDPGRRGDGRDQETDLLARLVAELSDDAQTIGAVGAVLGLRFRVGEVATISGVSEDAVVLALNELYRRGLVAVESRLGALRGGSADSDRHPADDDDGPAGADDGGYRFANAIAAAALLDTITPDQARIWHRRAAEFFARDAVRRARHVVASEGGAAAMVALIDAGDANLLHGRHYEAAADYQQATEFSDGPLPPKVLVGLSRALDLSGRTAEAEKVRSSAFDRALADGDHSVALALALSGGPEWELVRAPEVLLGRLDAVDPERLLPVERIAHAHYLTRQLVYGGRAADASRTVEAAWPAVETLADRVDLTLARRYVESARSAPASCLQILEGLRPQLDEIDVRRRADVLIHMAVDAYESAQPELFEHFRAELWRIVDQTAPIRRWHALLLDGVRLADQDRSEAGAAQRAAAAEHAIGHGIGDAITARLAGELAEQWILGEPLVAADELGADDVVALGTTSPLLDAGLVLITEAAGDRRGALVQAEAVVERALGRHNTRSAPSIAVVASVLARSSRHQLKAAALDMLMMRGDVMLLIGAFVAGLGPSARYAAHLESRPSERRRLLGLARDQAIRSGSRRWIRLTDPEV
ncbi:MAG: hypothetical protein AAF547_05450 [Actinomycetota bacterium]